MLPSEIVLLSPEGAHGVCRQVWTSDAVSEPQDEEGQTRGWEVGWDKLKFAASPYGQPDSHTSALF